jgi:hypothetical protein
MWRISDNYQIDKIYTTVIKGISSNTDANKLELNDGRYALDLVLGVRDNMMEDATGINRQSPTVVEFFLGKKSRRVFSYPFFY